MTVATALVSGNDPLPQLAEAAVEQALAKSGMTHGNSVLLFLTPEFARNAQQTVSAVGRRAQCTQVAGGIASGVFTEAGWALDRPAAAVMVFGGDMSLCHEEFSRDPLLSYCAGVFPAEWHSGSPRFGGGFAGDLSISGSAAQPVAWQNSRVSEDHRCSVQLSGAWIDIDFSAGWHVLGDALPVERSKAFDVQRIGGHSAVECLQRRLPAELRGHESPHGVAALLVEAGNSDPALARPIAIIATNADQTITLAERVVPGQLLAWAIRRPDTAQADMRRAVVDLAGKAVKPLCALMFSCIGRGPYFYGGNDLDLAIVRERFPELPIIGAYGTGQITPTHGVPQAQNRELNNSVVIALVSGKDRGFRAQTALDSGTR